MESKGGLLLNGSQLWPQLCGSFLLLATGSKGPPKR